MSATHSGGKDKKYSSPSHSSTETEEADKSDHSSCLLPPEADNGTDDDEGLFLCKFPVS